MLTLERPMLYGVADVMRECRVGRDQAYALIRGAGGIRLGKGGGWHVRPADLDEHLQRLRDGEVSPP